MTELQQKQSEINQSKRLLTSSHDINRYNTVITRTVWQKRHVTPDTIYISVL